MVTAISVIASGTRPLRTAAAPAAPSNLTGTGLAGGTQIQLSWNNNFTATSPATGNKIYRSPDNVNFEQIATVRRDATTFTDGGLTPGTLYYYRVVATNQLGDSRLLFGS